jgi:dTMP kinase
MFVAIEGGDGAGKTSIRAYLFDQLRRRGREVVTLQGPSWLVPGAAKVITDARYRGARYPHPTLAAAYVADREALSDRVVRRHIPWREVICDRFVLSDIVYQRVLWGVPTDLTLPAFERSRVARPDLTLFVDTPPDVALARLRLQPRRTTRFWDTVGHQRAVHELFHRLVGDPGSFGPVLRVDNSESFDRTLAFVSEYVVERIAGARP